MSPDEQTIYKSIVENLPSLRRPAGIDSRIWCYRLHRSLRIDALPTRGGASGEKGCDTRLKRGNLRPEWPINYHNLIKTNGRAAGRHRALARSMTIFVAYALLGRFLPRLGPRHSGPIFLRRPNAGVNRRAARYSKKWPEWCRKQDSNL